VIGPDEPSAQGVVPALLPQAASRLIVPAMPAVLTNFLLSMIFSKFWWHQPAGAAIHAFYAK